MKHIITVVLLAKDFDSLTDHEKIRSQFIDARDCPVMRALARQLPGFHISVSPYGFTLDYRRYVPVSKSRGIHADAIYRYAKMLQTQSKILLKFKVR